MLALPVEAPAAADWREIGAVAHVFTHFSLSMRVLAAESEADAAGEWWPVERVAEAGLPTVFAKAASLALAS
jgi:A/G-specific adenine glycosylase